MEPTGAHESHVIGSYVAIGDSFSEGLMDPAPGGEPDRFRGWADRLAELLVSSPVASPDLTYANLAVRGRLMDQVIDEQAPRALDLAPDLVSICAGGNDCMRPNTDITALASYLERAVVAFREAGTDVLIVNGFDTEFFTPLLKSLRPRVAIYNSHLWTIAQRHGCFMVDVWGARELAAKENWADDRIHLSPAGHELVANLALSVLEESPLPTRGFSAAPRSPRPVRQAAVEEASWVRHHLAPWVSRRLRGVSSGDALGPKLPELRPVRDLTSESD